MAPSKHKPPGLLLDEETGEVFRPKVVYSNMRRRNLPRSAYFSSNMPTKTVPDEAISVKQLFQRFATGIPLGMGKVPIFEEDVNFPAGNGINPKSLDLCDWEEMRIHNAKRNADLKAKDAEERKDRVRKQQEAIAKAKELAQKQQQNPEGTNIS